MAYGNQVRCSACRHTFAWVAPEGAASSPPSTCPGGCRSLEPLSEADEPNPPPGSEALPRYLSESEEPIPPGTEDSSLWMPSVPPTASSSTPVPVSASFSSVSPLVSTSRIIHHPVPADYRVPSLGTPCLSKKIVVWSLSSAAGVSSFVDSWVKNEFDIYRECTAGLVYARKFCFSGDQAIMLNIWHTPGIVRYQRCVQLKDVAAIILCIPIDDRASLLSIKNFIEQEIRFSYPHIQCMLVTTKADLEDRRVVQDQEVIDLARQYGYLYYLGTSAKEGRGVYEAFDHLLSCMRWKPELGDKIVPASLPGQIAASSSSPQPSAPPKPSPFAQVARFFSPSASSSSSSPAIPLSQPTASSSSSAVPSGHLSPLPIPRVASSSSSSAVASFSAPINKNIVLVGMDFVGKTSLSHRWVTGNFPQNVESTIGAAYCTKTVFCQSQTIKLRIWDTMSLEHNRGLHLVYAHGAAVGIFCVGVDKPLGYIEYHIKEWSQDKRVPFILMTTKADLEDRRQVQDQEVLELANKYGGGCFLGISALTGAHVDEALQYITRFILERDRTYQQSLPAAPAPAPEPPPRPGHQDRGCIVS